MLGTRAHKSIRSIDITIFRVDGSPKLDDTEQYSDWFVEPLIYTRSRVHRPSCGESGNIGFRVSMRYR